MNDLETHKVNTPVGSMETKTRGKAVTSIIHLYIAVVLLGILATKFSAITTGIFTIAWIFLTLITFGSTIVAFLFMPWLLWEESRSNRYLEMNNKYGEKDKLIDLDKDIVLVQPTTQQRTISAKARIRKV